MKEIAPPAPPSVTLEPMLYEHELEELQAVFDATSGYALETEGGPVRPTAAAAAFVDTPPTSSTLDKRFFVIKASGAIVGCIAAVAGHVRPDAIYVQLLLVGQPHSGRGIGRAAYEAFECVVRGWRRYRTILVPVMPSREAERRFWQACGLRDTGQTKPYRFGTVKSTLHLYAKDVG